MPAVLAFQDTETLDRLLGCDPSELRHETRPVRAPQPRTRRHPPRRSSLVSIPEITVNASTGADTIGTTPASSTRSIRWATSCVAWSGDASSAYADQHRPPLRDQSRNRRVSGTRSFLPGPDPPPQEAE